MIAPDFQTLYRQEELMECGPAVAGPWGNPFSAGLKGVFIWQGIGNLVGTSKPTNTPAIYTQREDVLKITPRIEIKFVKGAATYHQSLDNAGIARYDAWQYTLEILFVTDRSENFSAHNAMLGAVRAIMENPKQLINLPAFFPYTWWAEIKESGTVPGFHADDDTDMSQVKYTGQFFILPGSWPS